MEESYVDVTFSSEIQFVGHIKKKDALFLDFSLTLSR